MPANLNTLTIPELTDLIERSVDRSFNDPVAHPLLASGLFMKESIADNTGNTRRFSEFDIPLFASEKTEGDELTDIQVQYGYEKDVVIKTFGNSLTVSNEAFLQGKHGMVKTAIAGMADLVPNRMELDLEHRFTFGHATSYTTKDGTSVDITTGDGKALFATDHALAGSATTYRNIVNNNPQLSVNSLALAENVISQNNYTNLGELNPIIQGSAYLVVGQDEPTYQLAVQIVNSTSPVDAPNAGVTNVNLRKYRILRLPFLASTATGVIDTTKSKFWGVIYEKAFKGKHAIQRDVVLESPSANGQMNGYTKDRTWTVFGMYGIAILSGRGIAWSKGDGTA